MKLDNLSAKMKIETNSLDNENSLFRKYSDYMLLFRIVLLIIICKRFSILAKLTSGS